MALDAGALMVALPMVHAASLHTHGGAVGCVVDGWRYYGSVVGGAGCSCVGAGCWRSYGGVVGGVAGVVMA